MIELIKYILALEWIFIPISCDFIWVTVRTKNSITNRCHFPEIIVSPPRVMMNAVMTCKKNELKGEKIYVIMNTDQPE